MRLVNGWRTSWIIGGIAGALFPVISLALFPVLKAFDGGDEVAMILSYPVIIVLWGYAMSPESVMVVVPALIVGLVPYFIAGAVIGLIIGKLPTHRSRFIGWSTVTMLIAIGIVILLVYEDAKFAEYRHEGYSYAECDALGDVRGIELCYKDIYKRNPPDVRICERFTDLDHPNGKYRECAAYVGQETKDPDICATFSNDIGHDECFYAIAAYTELTPSTCDALRTELDRLNCYDRLATKTLDYSFCEKLTRDNAQLELPNRPECIAFIAQLLYIQCQTSECIDAICSSISDPEDMGHCKYRINSLRNR